MKYKKIYNLIIIIILLTNCATIRQTVNPLENPLLSWLFDKSCISVDVPPITLTTEKTILEKQILGEKTELMPEGWIILSPNYVEPFNSLKFQYNENIRKEIENITLYKSTIEYYIIKNYVGINQNGDFLILPDKFRSITEKKHLEIAVNLINIMNQSKKKIYDFLKEKNMNLANEFLEEYNNKFQFLGWRYEEKKGWYK